MARTTMSNARAEKELKSEVEGILKTLGLSTSEAINIFFSSSETEAGAALSGGNSK